MIDESRSALIARLQDQIHECLKEFVTEAPIAILDFPDIKNVGDSAIWLGETAYLKTRFDRVPDYTCTLRSLSNSALAAAAPEGPIFIHGGGNFGDIWRGHQDFRERVLDRWKGRTVVQFPQSIHYGNPAGIDETARVIARHGKFVLLVRDEESFQLAQKHFDCDVRLCPDMAFCIGETQAIGEPHARVLAMLRRDKEQVGGHDLSAYTNLPVEDWITEDSREVSRAKWAGAVQTLPTLSLNKLRLAALNAAAEHRFKRGVTQLSQAQSIVTDRLHVHIVSLLMNKPHAVLDNSYGKIGRFMSAFSGTTNLSYRASSFDDAMTWALAKAPGFDGDGKGLPE